MWTKKLNTADSYCVGATGCVFAFVLLARSVAWGQAPTQLLAGQGPFATPVELESLDPAAFCQMADGVQRPMLLGDGPRHVLWTTTSAPAWDGASFGDSKTPGQRCLRIGFTVPMAIGAVLVRDGGTVSVLRPEPKYPGDMADESQWLVGRRLVHGQPCDEQTAAEDYAVWVFPPGTKSRALRFSHTAQPTDINYSGWLGGAYVLAERMANLAPLAAAQADANYEAAGKIIDESSNGAWNCWDNDAAESSQVVSSEHPVSIVLAWPAPVQIGGLAALGGGFGDADVQIYRGPADRHPCEAGEGDWLTVTQWHNVGDPYPLALGPSWLDLGKSYTTRGVRLRITSAGKEAHPHLQGATHGGKRVWLRELMALVLLGDAPLESAVPERPAAAMEHPPIPVRFNLDRGGYVTLVIEDSHGIRVRNLTSAVRLPAGPNVVWWDGTTDLARDVDAAAHGVYRIPAELAPVGDYRVRGLVHPGIHLRYEFPVYNAGDPPWPTADRTGGWLANHTPPSGALFVPADKAPGGQALIYLGSYVSEGGDGLAWIDLDGHKRGGVNWVGGAWTGAPFLARDAGPHPAANTYLYVGSAWEGELRLTALTADPHARGCPGDKPVVKYSLPSGHDPAGAALAGLAVHDGLLVCSLRAQKELLFVDAKAGKVLGKRAADDPRGLAFDSQGRLLVLSGRRLLRLSAEASSPAAKTDPGETLITDGLEDPQHVVLDSRGNYYISDRGNSHQVKVFDPAGKLLRTIGNPGRPSTGPYDPNHMNDPNGLTIDSRGRLWVAETNFQPKRVSVWTLDGQLVRAFYGPSEYGGGGTLDPADKTRFYYHGMEFRLDWQAGTDRLARVFFRSDANDFDVPNRQFVNGLPETPIYLATNPGQSRRYFTNCYTSNPTNGAEIATLWIDRGHAAAPVAAIGRADEWDLLKEARFRPRWPSGVEVRAPGVPASGSRVVGDFSEPLMFVWTDSNADGRVQPDEVTFRKAAVGGFTVMPDLSVVAAWVDGRAMRYGVQGFTAGGAPRYDLARGETLAEAAQRPMSSGGDQALVEPTRCAGAPGWTVLTVAPKPFAPQSLGGVFHDPQADPAPGIHSSCQGRVPARPRWSYPNLWPGLHASHLSPPPEQPGELIGTTRLLGGFVTPRRGDAGPLWAINGNMGNAYLFTADGLFVSEMFRDVRKGVSWAMPIARRGMLLDDVSLHDENFWPSISQTADGNVYLVDGDRTCLVRVDGLDEIRRLPNATIQLTKDDLARTQEYLVRNEAQRQVNQGRPALRVAVRKTPPTVDGRLDDWRGADWASIDRSGVAAWFDANSKPYNVTASVAVSGDRLYAAFRTGDANLLQNSGEAPQAAFKTGGALDLMIGARSRGDGDGPAPVEGDVRLLVTRFQGKTHAVLYRPRVTGRKEPVPFSSPWRTVMIDRVDDVSDQVQLAGADGNFEFSIPLATLGLQPRPGDVIRGDLGVLRGNGFQTLHRAYWSNKATAIVSDVPSEAALTPNLWGRWVIIGE